MKLAFRKSEIDQYSIEIPVFSGPLDLLLSLIESAELDITKVALARVTDQYLAYLKELTKKSAEEVSEFLVIAAKLVQIKSEVLLPRPPERELGEEDPGDALARQLIAYKKFKEIAEILGVREKQGLRSYLRLSPPPKIESILDLDDITIDDIHQLALAMFLQERSKPPLDTVVKAPRITIREKISHIVESITSLGNTSFSLLLKKKPSRLDVVVTFLAMLELVKRHFIQADQEELFADITLSPSEYWTEDLDFDLEFGE